MTARLQGLETEYGYAILPSPPEPERENLALRLIERFASQLPCLPPANGNGWFLANGGRVYVDAGLHPEFATPEVDNPFDAVRYMLAGDRLLQATAADWSAGQNGRCRMFLFKSNVDHLSGATWACHESYGHRMDPRRLPAEIIPHLVSRIIYTGAGGLLPGGESLQFCLSPRARHLLTEISPESTNGRGIFHTKDESLAGPDWHRLHVLTGESLCSHRAAVLKLGTTALVLALAEAGLCPGAAVQLDSPLEALETFNLDLEGRATVALSDGPSVTAWEIQAHYLNLVRAHLDHELMPSWAPRLCQLWQETLDQLQAGPDAVAGVLDWGIKYAVYRQHLRHRSLDPASLKRWNRATAARPMVFPSLGAASLDELMEMMAQRRKGHGPPAAPEPDGFTADDTRLFRCVRAELAELEIRFGQLGPGGLFQSLETQGLLRHRVPGELAEEEIRKAMQHPPERGRAGVRGRLVRELASQTPPCTCEWQFIRDRAGRFLDLSDPWIEQTPAWKTPRPPR